MSSNTDLNGKRKGKHEPELTLRWMHEASELAWRKSSRDPSPNSSVIKA